MVRRTKWGFLAVLAGGGLAAAWCSPGVYDVVAEETAAKPQAAAKRPEPQPLADFTKKGLAYIVDQQNDDGGWGQGGGWRTGGQSGGRVEGEQVKDPSDVGNTCVAVLALIRAGNTPVVGEYATQVKKGVDFICAAVEKSDRQSLWVTDVRDTQLQSKIGQYVDTFLAALVLSELKGQVPPDKGGSRIEEAAKKTIAKIESNQKEDGTFAGNGGWASVLSVGLASKALNRAAQNGLQVKSETLKRDFDQAEGQLAAAGVVPADKAEVAKPVIIAEAAPVTTRGTPKKVGTPAPSRRESAARSSASTEAGDAGIKLYNYAANAQRINDQRNTNEKARREAAAILAKPSAPAEAKEAAKKQLEEFDRVAATNAQVVDGVVKQLDDPKFLAGFGNNGGEEFLSYMNLSETMLAEGGDKWLTWNKSISQAVAKAQNDDGSWSGHHCITGRTFCTATALLTLMADRAPLPEELAKK
jgi:hypothetical protein